MIQFKDLQVGQKVFVHLESDHIGCDRNGWLAVKVNVLIGDCEPNPGRTLVEVISPWLECGWNVCDVEDLYPAPNFETTYKMADVIKRLPDQRIYEFGIGDISNADDPYYAESQKIVKTGQRKMVLLKKCDGCGGEFPAEWMMMASLGRACPDCYDKMSG